MKKKRLLFISYGLNSNGADKSLISLLSFLDYKSYEVDLFLFEHKGLLMHQLPPEVNLISSIPLISIFRKPIKQSIKMLLKNKKYRYIIIRAFFTLESKFRDKFKQKDSRNPYKYKYFMSLMPILKKKYDVAVGYVEGLPIEILNEKVCSTKKIGWIHTDYIAAGFNPKQDKVNFGKMHSIVTISDKCKESLDKTFPEYRSKVTVIDNIVSPVLINKLALDKTIGFNDGFIGTRILTIGRLTFEKGIDIAIKVCLKLVENNYNIKWYIIGEGPEENKLKKLINETNLQDRFILLGTKTNPYPFIKQCNIYVQPSRYEGKPIAIEEAKILCKPLVVTNYPTVFDQIKDGKTGIVSTNEVDSIFEGIKKIIDDENLAKELSSNLKKQKFGNENEIEKFYELINMY